MKKRVTGFMACLLAMCALLVSGVSCTRNDMEQERRAVVSIEPLRYYAQRIGGPEWEVTSVVPQGFSPEDFMPTVSQMVALARARCLFLVGNLGFETTWLGDVLDHMPRLAVYDTSEGVRQSRFDPHTWTSPDNMRQICANMAAAFAEQDPDNKHLYQQRLQQTLLALDSLHQTLADILGDLPSRSFVIAHPALTEFASCYGLQQIAIEQDGKEPTVASIRQLAQEARDQRVRVVFVQQEFSEHSANVIAEEAGAHVVVINPLDYDYPSQMIHIAQALKNGE